VDHLVTQVALAVFWGASAALGLYGTHLVVLIVLYRRRVARRRADQSSAIEAYHQSTPDSQWPLVTTQIPLFNESEVAERVIEAAVRLDYPAGRHEIQVLDDSDDRTCDIVDRVVERWRSRGVHIRVIRRPARTGFKAGALALGLQQAAGEVIAIFDADFVPPADFLRRMVPLLMRDDRTACVQARWGHLNADESWLTRAQALGLDTHFAIEQGARAWNGLIMNFNGTAGVWRKAAISDPAVGGWSGDTLTEDLDLSYRAQLAGWKHDYCVDLVCPAELPGDIWAFKAQQRRWATGSVQVARKLLPRIWRSPLRLPAKLEATIHLTQHSSSVWMVVLALFARPVLLALAGHPSVHAAMWAAWWVLLLAAFAPWFTYVYARHTLTGGWRQTSLLPRLVIIGIGLSLSNALAVVRGLFSSGGEFVRTPKSGSEGAVQRRGVYRALQDRLWLAELALGAYAAVCLMGYLGSGRWIFSAFLLLYTVSYLTVGWVSHPRLEPIKASLQQGADRPLPVETGAVS